MKTITALAVAVLFLLVLPAVSLAREYSKVSGLIHKGLARQEIVKILGEPVERGITAKTNRFIWGPEEDFWDRIPMGTSLEVWKFQFADGTLRLYFINSAEALDFTAFAPKGVIY